MSEEKARGARARRRWRRSARWAYVGVDPADQLLHRPGARHAARRSIAPGSTLADIDFVDMHEAFAAQVLSVLKMLGSQGVRARAASAATEAVGEVDPARLNVHGGSIALGHPFGATGARMVTTMANELHRTGKETALLGICAAGGLGAAAVLERV